MKRVTTFFIAAALAASTSAAFAGGHGGNPAVKARQSHMQLYAHNLGILGGMARGNIEYDAGAAQAAANNLAALSTLDQRSYWVPGTSNAELGEATRALPALWEAGSTAREIGGQLAEAAATLGPPLRRKVHTPNVAELREVFTDLKRNNS